MTDRILPKPMVKDHLTAVWIGVLLFAAGAWFLYDAYERRGRPTPKWMRPVTFW